MKQKLLLYGCISTLIALLLFGVASRLSAAPQQEEEPLVLWIGIGIPGDSEGLLTSELEGLPYNPPESFVDTWLPAWVKRETGLDLEVYGVARTDGATKEIDTFLAADSRIDVYFDYTGRINKYAKEPHAVPLDEHFSPEELADFVPTFLDPFRKGDHLYALPEVAWSTCLAVNQTIFERAGVGHLLPLDEDPDRSWTYKEFLEMCEAVKALKDGTYGFFINAGSPGGDYFITGMIHGFGAKLYENNKIAINSPEGIKALEFLKMLQAKGYVPPGSAALTDYDADTFWFSAKCATQGGTIVNTKEILDTKLFEDGITEIPQHFIVMEYPHEEGHENPPVAVGPSAVMLFRSNPEREAKALKLLKFLTGPKWQRWSASLGGKIPTRLSVEVIPTIRTSDPDYHRILKLAQDNGVFDHGLGFPDYYELRALWNSTLQSILIKDMSVEEALSQFEKEANLIIERQ
ncbi:carbohydrate ABC transporter substrate-binding protein [Candidatus Pacearchaeota archaeon]|nr:carbohydrate ABC transporter substrate-binding protein [Candidatus Pacearchaeota archaeon]